MLYAKRFLLTGTQEQIAIVKSALEEIKFPFERLHFPNALNTAEIGWANLNTTTLRAKMHLNELREHRGGAVVGEVEGRKYVMGLMYPSTGRMFIDERLVKRPEIARAVVSAEIAHEVDYFLPLTGEQRIAIMALTKPASEGTEVHTWWEKLDYSAEYYKLGGEAFMQIFTMSFTNLVFPNTADFIHTISTKEQAAAVRKIIGVDRTDMPTPKDAPQTNEGGPKYRVFGKSRTYHRLSHYANLARILDNESVTDTTGLKPCVICKP